MIIMAMQIKETLKIMRKEERIFLEKELKANRKKNGKWERLEPYPCPCQCLAIRYIKPRGKQDIFRTVKKVKTKFLKIFPITEEKQIYVIYTYIPKLNCLKEGKNMYWKQTRREEISKSKVFQMIGVV